MKLIPTSTVNDRYYIYVNGEVVGILDYIDYGDEIEVKYIKIHIEHRRKGIATEVINMLKERTEKITGDALPEAIDFWKSMNARFYEEVEFDEGTLTPFIID